MLLVDSTAPCKSQQAACCCKSLMSDISTLQIPLRGTHPHSTTYLRKVWVVSADQGGVQAICSPCGCARRGLLWGQAHLGGQEAPEEQGAGAPRDHRHTREDQGGQCTCLQPALLVLPAEAILRHLLCCSISSLFTKQAAPPICHLEPSVLPALDPEACCMSCCMGTLQADKLSL